MDFLFLQAVTPTLETVTPEKMNLWDIILSSGTLGMVNMGINFLLSIYALYIFIERYMAINRAEKVDQYFMATIRDNVVNGNVKAALDLCQRTDTSIARMLLKGISKIGRPMKTIEVAIENEGNLEVSRLEKNLAWMATIAGAAPMLGFLGTVTGMIQAFYRLSTAGGAIDPGQLSGGIYQALMTTAVGLIVGIPAYLAYNYLSTRVEKVVYIMQLNSVEFVDLLQEPAA